MIDSILLVTGETEAGHMSEALLEHNSALTIRHAATREALMAAFERDLCDGGVWRVITFSTNVVVPEAVIRAMPVAGYNFHPGPPAYPGSCCANFAVYDGAETFGATVHELAKSVDTGAIVATRSFPIAPDDSVAAVQTEAFSQLCALFYTLASHLAVRAADLPLTGTPWTGMPRTLAAARAFSRFDEMPELDAQERENRRRAFGDLAAHWRDNSV